MDVLGYDPVAIDLALLAQSLFLVGTALLLRGAGSALMSRPRAWFAVATGSSVIMTVFCWHLTACYLVQSVLLVAGVSLAVACATVSRRRT